MAVLKTVINQKLSKTFKIYLNIFIAFFTLVSLSSCQINYYLSSAYNQVKILNMRTPINEVLKSEEMDDKTKSKLLLANEAKEFAETKLHLKTSKNYSTYVDLKRPYVSWIVHAAPKNQLKHFLWDFPFVGELPYKGFFNQKDAEEEADKFDKKIFDTYIRGVTAYSTLGWFNDPILNTMIKYSDQDLVNLIIHETVHATLYIKSEADFNEQLATFIGNLGTKLFFIEKDGHNSAHINEIENENFDAQIFSNFITNEIKDLEQWYLDNKDHLEEDLRQNRLKKINENFVSNIKSKLKTDNYNYFENYPLNNANLLSLKTYVYDLSLFEKVFLKLDNDLQKFLKLCISLEEVENPKEYLNQWLAKNED